MSYTDSDEDNFTRTTIIVLLVYVMAAIITHAWHYQRFVPQPHTTRADPEIESVLVAVIWPIYWPSKIAFAVTKPNTPEAVK
jgi:hypothetical protein